MLKVGGASLFHQDGFGSLLSEVLSAYRHAQVWLLVGGGDLVEAMRTANQIYPHLDPVWVHWQCVGLLDCTWQLAQEIYPTGTSIATREELEMHSQIKNQTGVCWVRIESFYSRRELATIPEAWRPQSNWETTTDCLAWLLAKKIDADQVVLMKQCYCDPTWSLNELSERGVIDSELARLAALIGARPQIRFAMPSR